MGTSSLATNLAVRGKSSSSSIRICIVRPIWFVIGLAVKIYYDDDDDDMKFYSHMRTSCTADTVTLDAVR